MSTSSAILRTIAYFDIFNFPLTAEEVFENLWEGGEETLENVKLDLQKMIAENKLETAGSYYFFPGRSELVVKRNRAAAEGEKKLRRAGLAVKLIGGTPFIKAIFVCNSVAAETSGAHSDIDFFIIGRAGRLWFVRFFCNLILKVFGLRTGARHSADRICLSFFVDDKHLDLSGLRVANDDIYLAYWLRQLYPVYDPENFLDRIQRENVWARSYVIFPKTLPAEKIGRDRFKSFCESALSGEAGDWYEKILKRIQMPKLRSELLKIAELGDKRVVISDIVLKFHETDARGDIREKWLANCKKYAS